MLQLLSVNFDDRIPNWRTQSEVLRYHVLVLVTDGKVKYTINGQEIIAERGDFLYIPQSTHRSGDTIPGTPHQKYTVLITTEPGSKLGIPFLDRGEFIRFRLSNLHYMQRRFIKLFEEMRGGRSFRSYIGLGLTQELIGLLARELEKPEVTPAKMLYAQLVKQYLLDHYREHVEIEQLGELIHRSPNYTTALFKEVFGQSPIRYMHQLRLLEACRLLLHSDMTVADIAQYLGYYDPSYFFRMFKKHVGLSPSEFIIRGRTEEPPQLFI
ncbi:helix-turn-helix domain-containing protein [Paenibacillus sp. MMO-58]|uniref:helix-turn-helix domain-containing protein n=1 Tax=Paenibacillus sp. MMO-58 TaxID=3081290 RepID=UPI00301A9F7D